jgi:DNA-binding NtrC family response regulator
LNTVEIPLPPLRDRREDLQLLAMHFLGFYSQRYRSNVSGFDGAAMKALLDYSWPGNVRELDHTIERAVLMAGGNVIKADDLGFSARVDGAAPIEEMSLEDVERFLVEKAMSRFDGNVTEAAKALGLSRSALYRRIEKYNL